MSSAPNLAASEFREPVQLMGRKFQQNKWAYYNRVQAKETTQGLSRAGWGPSAGP